MEETNVSVGEGLICADCGREVEKLKAKGMCSGCYRRALRSKGNGCEAAPAAVAVPEGNLVTVDFDCAPDLLQRIARKAAEELRPLGNQVVWELMRSVK